ncbi:MAG TPA: hypothetical protein VI110_10660 [Lapillicoccus sp.]
MSDGPCTMDISPTTSLVDVPAGIDDSVTIDGVVSVLPPPVADARMAPWIYPSCRR